MILKVHLKQEISRTSQDFCNKLGTHLSDIKIIIAKIV